MQDSVGFSEIYLVVRPEEKPVVARALDGRVGGYYTCFGALGRGPDGGLVYASGAGRPKRNWMGAWGRHEQLTAMLPKAVFYLVVPCEMADLVLEAARSAIRAAGSSAECARGFAWVSPILEESPIGAVPARPATPASAETGTVPLPVAEEVVA